MRRYYFTLEPSNPSQKYIIAQFIKERQVKRLKASLFSKPLEESLNLPSCTIHAQREVLQVRVLSPNRFRPEGIVVVVVIFVENEFKRFNGGSRPSFLYQRCEISMSDLQ
jgi:hypothetical protein